MAEHSRNVWILFPFFFFNKTWVFIFGYVKMWFLEFTNMVMLMATFRAMINNPFEESFDTIFMENGKNCQNINCFIFFPIKNLFK